MTKEQAERRRKALAYLNARAQKACDILGNGGRPPAWSGQDAAAVRALRERP